MAAALVLAGLLVLAHFFSGRIHITAVHHRMKMISFTAGVFITYLLLQIFPELYVNQYLTRILFVFVLIGFTLFHVIEKYVYRHAKNSNEIRRELAEEHAMAFFGYHVLIGVVLVGLTRGSLIDGILFFVPVLSFTVVSSVSISAIRQDIVRQPLLRLLLSVPSLIGVGIGLLFPVPEVISNVVLGFVSGTLLYILIVDSIPREKKGEPLFFLLGVLLYSLLIGITWMG